MLPIKRDKNLFLNKISNSLFEEVNNEDFRFDIVIVLGNDDVSFRDFSAYLLLIDHFFGRTYKKGFLSYSLTESVHLRAFEIKEGSIEITIANILKKLSVENTIYFFLLIKYLPAALKSVSEVLLNTSESFLNYEKAKLTRIVRKNLRKELSKDELLKNLEDDELLKLATKLQKKYNLDRKNIYKAARFAEEKMKSIRIQKRKKI